MCGRILASAGDDHKVILWNPDTGKKLHEWILPGPVRRRMTFTAAAQENIPVPIIPRLQSLP